MKKKSKDMELMFKGIHKDIDGHLQGMISNFLGQIETY